MASRPVVPQQVRGGLNKQHHPEPQKKTMAAGGENKSRRALGDIGNLAAGIVPEIPGKQITRPLTRSFRAQLLANAQAAAAADNNKQQICVNVDHKPAKKALVATKRPTAAAAALPKPKPKPAVTSDEVIVLSPDSEVKSNKKKCQERSKKNKKLQTLTSILTTSSKIACKPKEKEVFNIDASDAGNHLAAVEYVEDIYKFYKLVENESRPIYYMDSQPEINTRMRSILIDWLIDVHQKFDLSRETLYLTISVIDRFLSVKTVPRKELQLVGISATLLASKYEEIWPPEVNELVTISDRAYCGQQILAMEKTILAHLEWTLTVPTQFVFLARFAKAGTAKTTPTAPALDGEVEHMANYLSELGLMDYECSVMFPPSMAAAAAVYTARRMMNRAPAWTDVLEFHTGYTEKEVGDCGRVLVELMGKVKDGKLKTVFHKYSSSSRGSVALIPLPAPAANSLP
ncbi:unnamed protein product [Linum tenue]|uniref:B-like cyclin n=1 Tax=Linum tenue TaxID=586396 RepID=A0AAV0GR19_9ROSI|nr:unnamed protein product [Linum tenue]